MMIAFQTAEILNFLNFGENKKKKQEQVLKVSDWEILEFRSQEIKTFRFLNTLDYPKIYRTLK